MLANAVATNYLDARHAPRAVSTAIPCPSDARYPHTRPLFPQDTPTYQSSSTVYTYNEYKNILLQYKKMKDAK
jgi:hypothetical protein